MPHNWWDPERLAALPLSSEDYRLVFLVRLAGRQLSYMRETMAADLELIRRRKTWKDKT